MSASPLQKAAWCQTTRPRASEVIQSMSASERRVQEDSATVPRYATYIGTDGGGAKHHWSSYHRTVWIESNDSTETIKLDQTPLVTLGGWVEWVEHKRGEWRECRVGGSLVGDLAELLEGDTDA